MDEFGYERLEVWQMGMDMVSHVYALAGSLPRSEEFGLSSQMRRAAVSVPANIAEGYGRHLPGSFAAHLRIALGSVYEVRTLVEIGRRTSLVSELEAEEARVLLVMLSRKLDAFVRKISANAVREGIASYGDVEAFETTTHS